MPLNSVAISQAKNKSCSEKRIRTVLIASLDASGSGRGIVDLPSDRRERVVRSARRADNCSSGWDAAELSDARVSGSSTVGSFERDRNELREPGDRRLWPASQ